MMRPSPSLLAGGVAACCVALAAVGPLAAARPGVPSAGSAAEPEAPPARPPAEYFSLRADRKGLEAEGNSSETDRAAERALEWLRRHQSPDGLWRCRGFASQCKSPCKNLDSTRYGDGAAVADYDLGVTGLAVLAFTGRGYSHRSGAHQKQDPKLVKTVAALLRIQTRSDDPTLNGGFGDLGRGNRIYEHAICTAALWELFALSGDESLRKPATDAVRLVLRAQNAGFGWRYGVKPGDNDTSVTGWMVVALKTAWDAGADVPEPAIKDAYRGALRWLDRATAAYGKIGYMAPGDDGSMLAKVYAEPYPFSKELSCMTAVGVLSRVFCGQMPDSEIVRASATVVMRHLPRWQEQKGRALSTINLVYWYYGSLGLFQIGGSSWSVWQEELKTALLPRQRVGEDLCEDGSWDPIDEWGPAGGRVYATALAALTLETPYRFSRVAKGREKPPPSGVDKGKKKKGDR